MPAALELSGVSKAFTMHLQGGVRLSVVSNVGFSVRPGECTVLAGHSGAGKSSILKMIYGSYRCDQGQIRVACGTQITDIASAAPRRILDLRKHTIGYITQFLRAVPRVAAIDVVADPLVAQGASRDVARRQAAELLRQLRIPLTLWDLPPATFSGGEQQRVNIARGFLPGFPILLLDEPTASLDAANSASVVELIGEQKRRGTAIVAIVHDGAVRDLIADSVVDMAQFAAAA